ncbi:MAG: heme ABC transporter permease [Pseudomonadota bacterium]
MTRNIYTLASPHRFVKLSGTALPFLSVIAFAVLAYGLWLVFFVAPDDYQQGASVKIMFLHVPSAWIAMSCYTLMASAAIGTLVFRHPLADITAKAAAPIGATFTFICLTSGSLWGKPMWGTWWVWDARLTSVLILFIMYLALIALWLAREDFSRAARSVAILTLAGFINIPIIKFSVDWWNTLHQPASVLKMSGPSIHPSLLTPLLVMALAFTLIFIVLLLMRMRAEILRRRLFTLQIKKAYGDAA